MKLVTFIVLFVFITAFSACENHMDINDIVHGTPSNADTVLPHTFAPTSNGDSSKLENLPREFHVR
jgi:hypothetical protein